MKHSRASQQLYVARTGDRPSRRSYSIYHRFPGTGQLRVVTGLTLDHMAGYLEGASAFRWDTTEIYNGVPRKLEPKRKTLPKAIAAKEMTRVLELSGLGIHYPHLVSDHPDTT